MKNLIHLKVIGNGPAIILLHGWGFNHFIWYYIVKKLQDKFTFYLIDLPGFGLSQNLEWNKFIINIKKILPEKFALLGWSLGGLYATKLASIFPRRVTHLINVCSSPCYLKKNDWHGIDANVLLQFKKDLQFNSKIKWQDFVKLQINAKQPKNIPTSIASIKGLLQGLEILINWDLRQQFSQLQLPVMNIYGRLDRVLVRNIFKQMQVVFPKFNYCEFLQSGHMPFRTEAQKFIDLIKDFYL